jgi:hypothetical protein
MPFVRRLVIHGLAALVLAGLTAAIVQAGAY